MKVFEDLLPDGEYEGLASDDERKKYMCFANIVAMKKQTNGEAVPYYKWMLQVN